MNFMKRNLWILVPVLCFACGTFVVFNMQNPSGWKLYYSIREEITPTETNYIVWHRYERYRTHSLADAERWRSNECWELSQFVYKERHPPGRAIK
jgi:hypothetical protein